MMLFLHTNYYIINILTIASIPNLPLLVTVWFVLTSSILNTHSAWGRHEVGMRLES